MDLAPDLKTMLDIEEIDRDLYRGKNSMEASYRTRLYGGQVAAQALKAAGLTVPEGRHPHSLHGYFLRPGLVDRPVILRVDRDRDGGSFSARHVVAVQEGEVIFSMLCSFHVDKAGPTFEAEPLAAPDPDSLPQRRNDPLINIREINPTGTIDGKEFHADRMWVRTAHPVPDDRLTGACVLTYISDMGSGFGQLDVAGLSTAGPSIDHAVWFHHPVSLDGWLLHEMWPWKAGGQRGVYLGSIRDGHGILAATLSQESMLRPL